VCDAVTESLNFVEAMLRSQLARAIGHEVTPADFAAYMSFHYRRHLFQPHCAPKPFSHSVRRTPSHSPEGTVSIEFTPGAGGGGGGGGAGENAARPIETMSCARPYVAEEGARGMGFAINAATRVSFAGERHLHAWLRFDFAGNDGTSSPGAAPATLVCRARQFSSFVVVVGRLLDADTLDPVSAFMVQNRDEVCVPLEAAALPTPKAFRDAIASLSPEQQRFAKAFRQLQLNSTLFAVLVVQVKPQLEAVLNLPPDALTKEIKLTQDLMELFVEFQISADLLSYDAATDSGCAAASVHSAGATANDKLSAVKAHVAAMKEMISAAKDEELAARKQEHAFAHPMPAPSVDFLAIYDDDSFDSGPMKEMAVPQRAMMAHAPVMRSMSLAPPPAAAQPPPPPQQKLSASAPQHVASAPAATSAAPKPSQQPVQATPKQPATKQDSRADSDNDDLTKVAVEMDSRYDALDPSAALRPTILTPGSSWVKKAQAALLAAKKPPTRSVLGAEEQAAEKAKAFDLLDALSRSGALPLMHSELHVVVCATHAFDDSVVDTVIGKNVNPIEHAERSALIMAGAVHGVPARGSAGYAAMVKQESVSRVAELSPLLFEGSGESLLGMSDSPLPLGSSRSPLSPQGSDLLG
jgi:hypothetical protein